MKRFYLLFVNLLIVSGFIFTSCSNSDEEAPDPNSANLKTEKYSLSNCPDSLDVSELFNGYKNITRSISETSHDYTNFDFSSSFLLNIEEKEGNVYIIPATEPNNEGEYLIGVGSSTESGQGFERKKPHSEAAQDFFRSELAKPLTASECGVTFADRKEKKHSSLHLTLTGQRIPCSDMIFLRIDTLTVEKSDLS